MSHIGHLRSILSTPKKYVVGQRAPDIEDDTSPLFRVRLNKLPLLSTLPVMLTIEPPSTLKLSVVVQRTLSGPFPYNQETADSDVPPLLLSVPLMFRVPSSAPVVVVSKGPDSRC